MRFDTFLRLLTFALTAGAVGFACSSDEPKSTSTSDATVSSTGSPSTTSTSTSTSISTSTSSAATSAGGASSGSTMGAASTMGGANAVAVVTSDAVTIDSTSSTSASTADSTASNTSSGGSSTDGGVGGSTNAGAGGTSSSGEFTFSTPAFDNLEGCTCEARESCDTFPEENTSFDDATPNVSPEFNWSGAPSGTQSYAIVMQDIANGFVHWTLWNIPGTVTMLPAGLPSDATLSDPAGAQQATNFNQMGYYGPGACNVYEFTLYALGDATFTPSSNMVDTVKNELDAAGALATASIRAAADEAYCTGGGTCM